MAAPICRRFFRQFFLLRIPNEKGAKKIGAKIGAWPGAMPWRKNWRQNWRQNRRQNWRHFRLPFIIV